MLAAEGRILALDDCGILFYLKASAEKFDLIDSLKISETRAHVVSVGDDLILGELKSLAVYRWK